MTTRTEITQRFDQDALVRLYILDLSPLGGTIMRFTDAANGEVVFDGETYLPTDVEISGIELNSADSTQYPSIKISHLDNLASTYLDLYDDFIGARFYRIRTYARFLDDGVEPDPTQMFPPDKFYIERLVHLDGTYLEFELRTVLNIGNRFLPKRLVVSSFCDYVYRYWDGFQFINGNCPWNGTNGDYGPFYDENGAQVYSPSQDRCSKLLGSGCKIRFGAYAVLPYRGFPSLRKVRMG